MTDLLNFINMHVNAKRNGTLTIKMDDEFIVVSTVNHLADHEDRSCRLDNYFTRVSHEFELVIPYGNPDKEDDSLENTKTVRDFPEVYMNSYHDLEMTTRTHHCLRAENLYYLGDIIQKTARELRLVPNLGPKSLREIEEKLADCDLELNTVVENWPPIDLPENPFL